MIVGERPVNKVQIHIGESQILKALFTGLTYFPVLIVPDLRCDEQVFSFNRSVLKQTVKNRADLILVLIDRCAVKHPVA
jgi:hypothetical protein